MAEKLTDEQIRLIAQNELKQSLGFMGSDLSEQRSESMKRYLGEPYGNEKEGRSKAISTDIMDTVEWIMPSLLRIFTAGDQAGRFEPTKPGDEESATQATEFVNWIWNSQNEGFKNTYIWIKDGLIQKNGFVKIWCDEGETWEREEYEDLPDIVFAELVADPDVEVIEHSEKSIAEEMAEGEIAAVETAALHDVVVKRRKDAKKYCVENVPPEELLVSREAKHIQDARFVAHRTRKTISDLREMGYDEDLVSQIGGGSENATWNEENLARDTINDEQTPDGLRDAVVDESMREVWVDECYLRADRNGDGIAEMLQVTMAGNVVLDIEEWDGPRPFAAWTPIIMPHRFFGLSIADIIDDLQLIKTTLLRQYLDALYIANTPRIEVKEDQIIDPNEVMDSRPGGIVRTTGATPALIPIQQPFVGDAAIAGMNYIDQLRENRTGVSPRVQGLGANSLHDTASGEQMLLSKAMEKVELIARVFAETGLRDAFKLLLSLVCRHQDASAMVRLRGKWVPMDPRAWANDFDFTVSVGLGHGSREMLATQLQKLLGIQIQAIQMQGGMQGPMVNGTNVYNTLSRFVEAIGLKSVEPYFSDPSSAPPMPQQPKQDPLMADVMARHQAKMQELQMQAQANEQKAITEMQLERYKADLKAATDKYTAELKAQTDLQIAGLEAQLKATFNAPSTANLSGGMPG